MFAAFPNRYATVFSALYLPLLAILFAMILRIVAYRMARQDRRPTVAVAADAASRSGRGCPQSCGASRSQSCARVARSTPTTSMHLSVGDVLNPYTLLGGLATASLFAFHGAVFIALKTAGAVRDDAFRFARCLRCRSPCWSAAFGLWTQLAHGKGWTWLVLGVAVVALAVGGRADVDRARDGWAFVSTVVVVAAVVVLLFGSCTRTWCRRR